MPQYNFMGEFIIQNEILNFLKLRSSLRRSELQFVSNKHHSRAKRNVFYDMIQDFTDADDDDDDSEEEEEEEEDEKHHDDGNSATTTSESIESSTTRFGRFMSPLAFSKISETLGFYSYSFYAYSIDTIILILIEYNRIFFFSFALSPNVCYG